MRNKEISSSKSELASASYFGAASVKCHSLKGRYCFVEFRIINGSSSELGSNSETAFQKGKELAQRTVAFLLLLALVSGIGYSHSRDVTRRMLCDFYCDEKDIPIKIMREFLNDMRDVEFQYEEDESDRETINDDSYPIEEPYPDDYHNYYAVLTLKRQYGTQLAIPLTRYESLPFFT